MVSALVGSRIFYLAEDRIRRPTMMIRVVLGLLAAGRSIEFFARSDSATTLLGLEAAQWTSLLLIAFALAGALVARRVRTPRARTIVARVAETMTSDGS